MSRRTLNFALACLFLLLLHTISLAECLPEKSEIEWLEQTVRVWKQVRDDSLGLEETKLPWMVLFDEKCVLNINPDKAFIAKSTVFRSIRLGSETFELYSAEHLGKVVLPNSSTIPPQLISFAATYDSGNQTFFAASLPSIWQKAPHLKDEKDVNTLVRSVYIHELTHTYHRNFFSRLDSIEKGVKDVENFDDDVVQNIFGKIPEFREAVVSEIAIADQAVKTKDLKSKRKAARTISRMIDERRRKYYTDQQRSYAEIEDIFLTMEGVANWAAYKAAMRDGLSSEDASKLIRRGGKYWSQEQGILLFLLIDDLVPNWQKTAFGAKSVSITKLLNRASR